MRFGDETTVLVVAPHPDDETLGFGGSAHALSRRGITICSVALVGDADARGNRPELRDLHTDADEAHAILGMEPPVRGSFPNIKLNTVPHLDLVQFIEDSIRDLEPDIVVTVHPGDINDDHYQVSRACQAAVRLPQRQSGIKPIRGLLFMEVPSSTDWSILPASSPFKPQMFIEIDESSLDAKVAALSRYRGVMRDGPHPRSEESVRALATIRGSEAGLARAEAFEVGFLKPTVQDV